MNAFDNLRSLAGKWTGTNTLHLSWLPDPVQRSDATAVVQSKTNGQCVQIDYTWSHEGEDHNGILLLCPSKSMDKVAAAWTDSWHSAHVLMNCDGQFRDDGSVSLRGNYTVPGHPDWGWRTEVIPGEDTFQYKMYNISPEGVEEIAVEMNFSRST